MTAPSGMLARAGALTVPPPVARNSTNVESSRAVDRRQIGKGDRRPGFGLEQSADRAAEIAGNARQADRGPIAGKE